MTARNLLHRLIRGHWGRITLSTILTLLASALALPLAWIVRQAFDSWVPQSDGEALLWAGFAILGLRVVSALTATLTRWLNAAATEDVTVRLRLLLTQRFFRTSRTESDQYKPADLHDILFTETQRFHRMAGQMVGVVVPSALKSLVLTGVLLYLSWRLLALMMVVWPVVWVLNEVVRRYLQSKVKVYNRSVRMFSRSVFERIRLLDLTRFENREKKESRDLSHCLERVADAHKPVAVLDTAYSEVQAVVLTLIAVVVLMAGGNEVAEGRMSLGDFVSFYMVVSLLNQALRDFSHGIYHAFIGWESMTNILAWLNTEDDRPYRGGGEVTLTRELELRDVHFGYGTREPFLNGVDFSLKRGETVVLLGPNGSGKSTIIWLLLGLYGPSNGTVRADGHDYHELHTGSLRAQIGIVPQEALLLDGNIRENVAYGREDAKDSKVEEALRLSGSDEWISELPEGLDTNVGPNGTLLSGGQRQRISLARALLKNPTFLIFDEPTNHLDDRSVKEFLTTIQGMNSHPGVLIITHDQALRAVADKVYELREGSLVVPNLPATCGVE